MRIWSGTDLTGFVLSFFGIFCVLFSNSPWLTNFAFVVAVLAFMHSVYRARYDIVQYREMLCHYQAILSASEDGWIAWNDDNEYVGSSKKFKKLMKINVHDASAVRIVDIMEPLVSSSADDLAFYLNKLLKTGEEFKIVVQTKEARYIEISGARKIISKVESIVLWCSDVTEISSEYSEMKDTVDQLTASLNSMTEILNTLPIPVWRRSNDLHITYCNSAYSGVLNKNINEIIATNIPLIPGTLFGQGHSLAENARKCNKSQTVVQSTTVNGIRKQFAVHECIKSNGNFIGYALDVTNSEKLASQLDKIITSNCEVLNGISSAIAIFDSNMRLCFFNTAYQYTMKLEMGWLHSKPTFSEILDELRSNRHLPEVADFQAFKKEQMALFTSVVEPVQNMLHLPSGKSLRQMIAPHSDGGLIFIYEDVTNSLLLQQKNDTLLAVQKETIDHLYEGIMVCGSDNRIKIINKALADIWGIDLAKTKIRNMHLSELLDLIEDQLDYEGDWQVFKEYAISNLTDRMTKTGRLTKKDNSIILFSYVPLPDGAHMHSMIDITDNCTVENAIVEKNQVLNAAHRLEMEFIMGVSTEIKEPLTVLIGYSELLLHEYFGTLNDKQREYCKYILHASNQLHQLINNTIDMISIDRAPAKLEFCDFKITEALEEVMSNFKQRTQEKNVEIVRSYEENLPLFHGDKVRMKQVLFNLILNAIQFSPIGGLVEVIIRTDDSNIKILVKDAGTHRSEGDSKRKIFTRIDKESNIANKFESNNISMPLVRSIVSKHGGKIKIVSDVEGTSVMCVFPLHKAEENTIELSQEALPHIDEAVNS